MKIAIENDIVGHRDQIFSALMDPTYYEFLGSQVVNIHPPELISAQQKGDSCTIEVRYAFAGTLSGPARMAVDPAKLTWVIRSELDRTSGEGQLTMTPDHYSGLLTCSATLSFVEQQGICTEVLRGELAVHVPMIGHTAEVAIVQGLRHHVNDECRALSEFIACQ